MLIYRCVVCNFTSVFFNKYIAFQVLGTRCSVRLFLWPLVIYNFVRRFVYRAVVSEVSNEFTSNLRGIFSGCHFTLKLRVSNLSSSFLIHPFLLVFAPFLKTSNQTDVYTIKTVIWRHTYHLYPYLYLTLMSIETFDCILRSLPLLLHVNPFIEAKNDKKLSKTQT